MLIPVSCPCGRSFRVNEGRVGKKGRCPSCGLVLTVALPEIEASRRSEDSWMSIDFAQLTSKSAMDVGTPPIMAQPFFRWACGILAMILFGVVCYSMGASSSGINNTTPSVAKPPPSQQPVPDQHAVQVASTPTPPHDDTLAVAVPMQVVAPPVAIPEPPIQPVSKYPPIGNYDHAFKIEQTYDKFRDRTCLRLDFDEIFRAASHAIELSISNYNDGKSRSFGNTSLYFVSRSENGWIYLNYHEIIFLVDGDRWTFDPEHHGDVKEGYVKEGFFIHLSESKFLALIDAKEIEIKIGINPIRMTKAHMEAIKDFASLLGDPSSPIIQKTVRQEPKPIERKTDVSAVRPARSTKKKPDFSQVDSAFGQMAENLASQLRAQEMLRRRASFESAIPSPFDTPTNNSHLTGLYSTGLCGAACLDGHACRNRVIGGGYCYIHRN